jgi:hypothetical protein
MRQVLAASREQVEAATHEVAVMESLHHPNLLALLASSIVPFREGNHVVYMLFPLYQVSLRHLFVPILPCCRFQCLIFTTLFVVS